MNTKRFAKLFLGGILAVSTAFLTACARGDDSEQVELLIGAAMSLIDVNGALEAAFEEAHPNIALEFTHASSGALQGQIEAGADIDVFMSAALAQMRNLEEQGLIYGPSRNLVRNTVALVVPYASTLDISSFADVAHAAVERIGIGDEAMPIGNFGREVFDSYGVLDIANQKSVLGTEVRMILNWVELGEVDAGVVFLTDAVTSDDVRVVATADPARHSPSINPVGIVDASPNKEAAQTFIDFLFSPAARAIFEEFGFSMYN
jgi:molybdate transport system substrate-binding protein